MSLRMRVSFMRFAHTSLKQELLLVNQLVMVYLLLDLTCRRFSLL
jgi:hypothetical protein